MSLPAPELDNRSFQSLVDDMKRQIGLRCPEWTDHNVSDPGVTMVELFAYTFEQLFYRLNLVPERNYIKFLEMLGVTLKSAESARAELHFRLSRPITDASGDDEQSRTLKAIQSVVGTLRTETEESIEFALEEDLVLLQPRLTYVISSAKSDSKDSGNLKGALTFDADYDKDSGTFKAKPVRKGSSEVVPFEIYGEKPEPGNALYLGFENNISGCIIQVVVECLRAAGTGLNEEYPAQVWEYWDHLENRWDFFREPPIDRSGGFNFEVGHIEIIVPRGLQTRIIDGKRAYWVRVRYSLNTSELPPRKPGVPEPVSYDKSPQIQAISARTAGGIAPAVNCVTHTNEILGQSDGTPGQVFRIRNFPILFPVPGETIVVGPEGGDTEEWRLVPEFSDSGPEDRHFMLDCYSGEVIFGPNILSREGKPVQYGAVPPHGYTITFSKYRYGGGIAGNVREHTLRVLKDSPPYISEVTNPVRASGGKDLETLEACKMRAQRQLRVRERAVTSEDYEFLAASRPGVGRARCVQAGRIHATPGQDIVPAGIVRVLIVPALGDNVDVPRYEDLRVPEHTRLDVLKYLDERRLLTSVLDVREPDYLFVSTEIIFVPDPRADQEDVTLRVKSALERFLHPLKGGPEGKGWPFGRPLTLADVYAQIGEVRGVAFLTDARMSFSRVVNGRLSDPEVIPVADGLKPTETELICTREHTVRPLEMWRLGSENAHLDR